MATAPSILLVNPWIHDFAAHDMWAKPLGLLLLGALLRGGGCSVALVDCLDRRDPGTVGRGDLLPGQEQRFGCGKYPKLPLPVPPAVQALPRRYFRYGIHEQSLRAQLRAAAPPDLIWVTSGMTYWYPGVQATIRILREKLPGVPIWLGGIYARLCPAHAASVCGADRVVTAPLADLPHEIASQTGFEVCNRPSWQSLRAAPAPAVDLLPNIDYVPLLTGLGCRQRCPYCASGVLDPGFVRRTAQSVYQEIATWRARGRVDFTFHDDALLLSPEETLLPVLERLSGEEPRLRLHAPNGLHIAALAPDLCRLLYSSGFESLRLGFETADAAQQRRLGGKTDLEHLLAAMENLRVAGFSARQIGVNLLAGLPGQRAEEVEESLRVVARAGAQPRLNEYSPIPGTALWPEAVRRSPFDLAGEPLTHNNSLFPCRGRDFEYSDLVRLKILARTLRADLLGKA